MKQELLTTNEIAFVFGVKRIQVWRWRKKGLIKPHSFCGSQKPLFLKSEIEEFATRKLPKAAKASNNLKMAIRHLELAIKYHKLHLHEVADKIIC